MGCNSSQPNVQGNGEIPTKDKDKGAARDKGTLANGIDEVEVPEDWEWIPEFKDKAVIKPVKRDKYLDTKFPPVSGSLFFSKDQSNVEWKRPNVIPPNQSLYWEDHKGIVLCRFWRYEEWQPIYVDDTLPTMDSELIFGHCNEKREFWLPMLEKAYAKLHGSYESLDGGQALDALVDLTGGIAQYYDMQDLASASEETQQMVFDRLVKAMSQQNAFVTCDRVGVDTDVKDGLVNGHAYTVTGAAYVPDGQSGQIQLVRIRNPWGNATEWTGAWNDRSVVISTHVSGQFQSYRLPYKLDHRNPHLFQAKFCHFSRG
ncbi:unnamed protein product [Darwinula stevensoni]|uniref:Calpain catalytic domain-containing protein n=1 Tax=Darwinula stevensoni TaxID=69355 RepID=A0A7R9A008_9CRUS|nr:unnamed protein product [Darwinula stevensoni]CAG0880004.1 unnamed protein product [Darwinula stevensoni]